MSAIQTAFRTADPEVLASWKKWSAGTIEVQEKRKALVEAVGRDIYVNRGSGFGSTRVVGFKRFDSDKQGDLVHHDGCLIVSSYRGQHNGLVVPNLKRRSGKKFAEELREYTTPGLALPGMATFHVYGDGFGRMYMGGPDLHMFDGGLYAFWECDDAPVKDNWEQIPLSTYYLAKEQAEVSGNEETQP